MLLAGTPHGPAPEAPSSSFQREGQLGGALLMKEFVGTPGVLKGLRVPGGSSIPGSGHQVWSQEVSRIGAFSASPSRSQVRAEVALGSGVSPPAPSPWCCL